MNNKKWIKWLKKLNKHNSQRKDHKQVIKNNNNNKKKYLIRQLWKFYKKKLEKLNSNSKISLKKERKIQKVNQKDFMVKIKKRSEYIL